MFSIFHFWHQKHHCLLLEMPRNYWYLVLWCGGEKPSRHRNGGEVEAHCAPPAVTLRGESQLQPSPALCRDSAFMKHFLLRLTSSLQWFNPKSKAGFMFITIFHLGGEESNGSAQICDQGKNTLFYYQGRREKSRFFFFFFLEASFLRKWGLFHWAVCRGGGQTVTPWETDVCSIFHIFEVNLEACGRDLRMRTDRVSLSSAAEDLWDMVWGYGAKVVWNL